MPIYGLLAARTPPLQSPARSAVFLPASAERTWDFTRRRWRLARDCLNLDVWMPPLVDSGWAIANGARCYRATKLTGCWLSRNYDPVRAPRMPLEAKTPAISAHRPAAKC